MIEEDLDILCMQEACTLNVSTVQALVKLRSNGARPLF